MKEPGSDHEAKRVKKGKKSIFGYKNQVGINEEGMVLGVHTIPANEHDSRGLKELLNKIPPSQRKAVMADKGYKSKSNDEMLEAKGSKSRIIHKFYRNNPLTSWQKRYN